MSGADDRVQAYNDAMLAEFSRALTTLSEVSERLATGVKDHVLYAGSVVLEDLGGGVGGYQFVFSATVGSVEVHNRTDGELVVVSSTQQASPPSQGKGVHHLDAGVWRVVPIGQRVFTIYGDPADVVEVIAMTTGGGAYGAGVLV